MRRMLMLLTGALILLTGVQASALSMEVLDSSVFVDVYARAETNVRDRPTRTAKVLTLDTSVAVFVRQGGSASAPRMPNRTYPFLARRAARHDRRSGRRGTTSLGRGRVRVVGRRARANQDPGSDGARSGGCPRLRHHARFRGSGSCELESLIPRVQRDHGDDDLCDQRLERRRGDPCSVLGSGRFR